MSEPRRKRGGSSARGRANSGEVQLPMRTNSAQNRGNMNGKNKCQRQQSYDQVRKIVQEEGREARNLIIWNVPYDTEQGSKPAGLTQADSSKHAPVKSSRSRSTSGRRKQPSGNNDQKNARPKDIGVGFIVRDDSVTAGLMKNLNTNQLNSSHTSGVSTLKKGDLRARYWAFLFENLKRAVDEIYQTCEADESVVECKEVIMILEQCTKDFQSLIEKLDLLKAFEEADKEHKPTSLAWEVRKSSPGKALANNVVVKDFTPSPTVIRSLNFSALPPNMGFGKSWADRVKGISPKMHFEAPIPSSTPQPKDGTTVQTDVLIDAGQLEEDTDGWETVQRCSRTKRPLSAGTRNHNIKNSQKQSSKQRSDRTPSPNKNARNRTNSIESEKENQPIVHGHLRNCSSSGEMMKTHSQSHIEDTHDPSIVAKGPAMSRSLDSQLVSQSDAAVMDQARESTPVKKLFEFDLVSEVKDLLADDDEDDDDDDEEAELDHALATALDAEEDLSTELEKEQEAALESAIKAEQDYLQAIAHEQSLQLDEPTDPETESDLGNTASSAGLEKNLDWDTSIQKSDAEGVQTKSWADMVDEAESRTPGRVVHMHEKLSSPSRKRSPTESRKRFEEKQAKAQELRQKLYQEKSERLGTLTSKVEEVRAWKEELLSQRRDTMLRKLDRANEKRNLQLKLIIRKAHEEENKANEIAFINTLEAQNKRHDIFIKYQESEARLQDIQEERQRKHEEKLAKEVAVEERRRILQAERQARLHEMQERRRQREEIIEQRIQEKEKDRFEAARAKEQYRGERIAALNAQQQAHIEELQKKIQLKQEETVRRHKENLSHIAGKAFGMSILRHSTEDHNEAPKLVPYETQKLCSVCNVMIPSEVHLSSHLRGKRHLQSLTDSNNGRTLSKQEIEEFNLLHITNAPCDKPDPRLASDKERQKSMKKRCKKLRQRMAQRGTEYEGSLSSKQQLLESEHKAKLQKIIKDLTKYLQIQDKGPWPQNKVSALDRGLGEICRIFDKKVMADQNTFRIAGGLTTLSRVLLVIGDSTAQQPPVIPPKSLVLCSSVYRQACKGSYDNCHYMLFSNKAASLVDLLNLQLTMLIPENLNVDLSSSGGASGLGLPHDTLATSLIQLLATVLSVLAKHNPTATSSEASAERMSTSGDAFMSRANDIVSYIISVGILDRLTQYFNNVRGSINKLPQVGEFLQHSMGLLIAMIRITSKRNVNLFEERKKDDVTQLVSTFEVTNLVGIVSLMYGMLLHSGSTPRGETSPPELPSHTLVVATYGFRMLNYLATLDLQLIQRSLGEEGTSLEFRHISSYMLWYCNSWTHEELLHEVILCVGYFTILNSDNQSIIQSGQPPTVLQQLCSLPFQYFSDPKLTSVLFPTLITCCYNNALNREILEQELSCSLLANFIEEKTLESESKSPILSKKSKTLEKEPDTRMSFGYRFPPSEWQTAQDYFKASSLSLTY